MTGTSPLRSPIAPAVASSDFRATLGHYCTGVAVIAGYHQGPAGFACQSFAALSLDPPLVTFSVANTSRSWPRIARSGAFCASILGGHQIDTCRTFGTPEADKFGTTDWALATITGSPRLTDAIAWIDCEVTNVLPGGDHTIVIGRVVALDYTGSDDPLVYYRGRFHTDVTR
ncbi:MULTISPECIES: flavin reductase family protein [unclassified Micromonospora]|uniref:flavin reductase family protein n=1 Tax=unclassified Micromonospora TaxID=2617518 RepID=UPI001C5F7BFD|nr:flavin reductase family protein [Micromonospora sp. RL09-050-HVF-A]MBW4702080.1 flavin reductase family protein [Micromonospora sp. RL09-050-HVF-A]